MFRRILQSLVAVLTLSGAVIAVILPLHAESGCCGVQKAAEGMGGRPPPAGRPPHTTTPPRPPSPPRPNIRDIVRQGQQPGAAGSTGTKRTVGESGMTAEQLADFIKRIIRSTERVLEEERKGIDILRQPLEQGRRDPRVIEAMIAYDGAKLTGADLQDYDSANRRRDAGKVAVSVVLEPNGDRSVIRYATGGGANTQGGHSVMILVEQKSHTGQIVEWTNRIGEREITIYGKDPDPYNAAFSVAHVYVIGAHKTGGTGSGGKTGAGAVTPTR